MSENKKVFHIPCPECLHETPSDRNGFNTCESCGYNYGFPPYDGKTIHIRELWKKHALRFRDDLTALTTAVNNMLACEKCGGYGEYHVNQNGYYMSKVGDRKTVGYSWKIVKCQCRKDVVELLKRTAI